MIATRFNLLGVSAKPYAYEVEYLESTGTQWIDTGIVPNNETGFKLEFMLKTSTSDMFRFGCRQNSGDTRFVMGTTPVNLYAGFGEVIAASPVHDNVVGRKNVVELNFFNDRQFVTDIGRIGTQLSDISDITFTYSLIMFGRNNGGSISSNEQTVYACQITQGGSFVRDFIPVVDHEGVACMYDKVTKQLFYNQGTGKFIAGPKINHVGNVSAKSYIQEGLIAHLDGIENDGYGKHSSSPSTWKDLTGKNTLTPFGVPIYNENHVFLDGGVDGYGEGVTDAHFEFNSQHIVNAINSGKFSIELIQMFSDHPNSTATNCGHIAFGENVRGFWLWTNYANVYSSFSVRQNGYTSAAIAWNGNLNKMFKVRVLGSKLYINSELIGEDLSTGTVTGLLCMIGKLPNLSCIRGNFYAVRMYDHILTEDEIALNDSIDKERFGI